MKNEEIQKELDNIKSNFFDEITYRLSAIQRYNTRHFVHSESVLEHTGAVVLISTVISDYFNEIGIKNNTELVMKSAVFHDAPEVISGDLPHNAKYQHGKLSDDLRKSLTEFEDYTLSHLISKLPKEMMTKYLKIYVEYKEKKSLESKIVKLGDFMSVILYSEREMGLGNNNIYIERDNSKARFYKLFDEIMSEYNK